jgi:hypothetical protein
VFLGFLSFYLLATFIEAGYFTKGNRTVSFPLIVFSVGIFANEILLMIQGIGILFQTNNDVYKWLLWVSSILLFFGALSIAFVRLTSENKSHRSLHGL